MGTNAEQIQLHILIDIMQALGYEEDEYENKEVIKHINSLSKYELFNLYLQWHGFIGWTDNILEAVQDIFVDFEEMER